MTVDAAYMPLQRDFFQRWAEPLPHEPATAFFSRLVGMNLQTSARVFAQEMGIDGRELRPAECLEAVRHLPIKGMAHLVAATPVVTPQTVQLLSVTVRRKHWSGDYPRYCPACVAESAHYRTYHGLTAFTVCPFHGCDIETARGGNDSLSWRHPSLAETPDGTPIGRRLPRRDQPSQSFETWLLGQLGVIDVWTVPLLEGVPVRIAIETVDLLGRVAVGGWSRKAPRIGRASVTRRAVVEKGFQTLLGGPEAVEALLESIAAQAGERLGPANVAWGLHQSFGWLFNALVDGERTSRIMSAVQDAAIAVAKRRGTFGRKTKRLDVTGTDVACLHREEIGRRFGISPKVIDTIARYLHIERSVGGGCFFLYQRSDVETMQREFDAALDRKSTAAQLGLSAKDLRSLERTGVLRPFFRYGGATNRYDRFRASDIATLAPAHLPQIKDAKDHGHVEFTALSRATGLSGGDLAAKIERGQIKPIGRSCYAQGFRNLIFSKDVVEHLRTQKICALQEGGRERLSQKNIGLTRADARAVLGISPTSLNALNNGGYIQTIRSKKGSTRECVDRPSLQAFADEYALASAYATALGCSPYSATRTLRTLGVAIHGIDSQYVKGLTAFVRKADVTRMLGLREDPITKQTEWARFWTALGDRLSAHKSIFRLFKANDRPSARLITGDRRTSCTMLIVQTASASQHVTMHGRSAMAPPSVAWSEIHRSIENLAYAQRCHHPERDRDQVILDDTTLEVIVIARSFRQQRCNDPSNK
ncbi:TniQ family protein [Methylobacterium sp. 10]|uniref:TniQ family protein n=1 Tax=Methylobacterium sp. 10 TaxID=1101191 RepID=UPI0004B2C687|nr:TniQ family protein [Methylobacterium sp. 10]